MAIWEELPVDLLVKIANRVKVMEDFIALRAVCTSWRVAITKDDMFSPQVPLLMLNATKDNKYHKYREFYSLSKKKVVRVVLPEARGRDCVSSEGWLCTMSCYRKKMNLLHPFSRTQIQLPPLISLVVSLGVKIMSIGEESLIQKVALSASPSITSDYVLMISVLIDHDNYLAFWRSGDRKWSRSNINTTIHTWGNATSIIYYNGQFYCVTCYGQLWVFDIVMESKSIHVKPRFVARVDGNNYPNKQYYRLVKTSNALLIVTKSSTHLRYKVSELDTFTGRLNNITNLGDSSIFLSNDGGSIINCSGFRGVVKPNHIYFTDMWTYNIENEKIEYFHPGPSSICPLTWVTPSFQHRHVTRRGCCL
ncbi:F-box protein At2g26160-like [Solanum verrucosum]|uniref:F-box protein At2g26160-like n=1 Tax=Solanum verrucosum TaxID=315347 RepID=UPI0020D12CB7|nr:F-box protein At2g26160-like [Solanum verrucosum]